MNQPCHTHLGSRGKYLLKEEASPLHQQFLWLAHALLALTGRVRIRWPRRREVEAPLVSSELESPFLAVRQLFFQQIPTRMRDCNGYTTSMGSRRLLLLPKNNEGNALRLAFGDSSMP
jgi:hypothetical protein